jgi:hypothetical protein
MGEVMDNYYGNSSTGFEADEPAPTLILICPYCHADILFYGDGSEGVEDGTYTLNEYYVAVCTCGAIFGEDDTLEIRPEGEAC